MTVHGLDHVTIKSPRLRETQAFFADVLGLEVGWLYRHIHSANDLGRQAFFKDPNGVMIERTWLKAGKR